MIIPDENLSYEKHFEFYRAFLTGNPERDSFWHFKAQEMHILNVMQAAGDIQGQVVSVGQCLPMGTAYHHLVFGAGRRSKMIWGAFRQLYGMVPPDRTKPLPADDAFEVARALNDIYIHTRGMLDNFAWAILHIFGDEAAKVLHQNDIGLFQKRFKANPSLAEFCDIAAEFNGWAKELSARRDPVAHRIPLSVPPSCLNEEEAVAYSDLQNRANGALLKLAELGNAGASFTDIEAISSEVESLQTKMTTIGRFAPFIVHDPAEGGVRIYPTVPEDIGQLVKLSRRLLIRILERLQR